MSGSLTRPGAGEASDQPLQRVVLSEESSWRHLARGSEAWTVWRDLEFDDSGWQESRPLALARHSSGPHRAPDHFRRVFEVEDADRLQRAVLRLDTRSPASGYLNGREVFRLAGAGEPPSASHSRRIEIDPALLVEGHNLLAVEIRAAADGGVGGFHLRLTVSAHRALVTLGPYLEPVGKHDVAVRWRTDAETIGRVCIGAPRGAKTWCVDERTGTARQRHRIIVRDLEPGSRYVYSVGSDDHESPLLGGAQDRFSFQTAGSGSQRLVRAWVIGDSGAGSESAAGDRAARAVRDSYLGYQPGIGTDVWLTLGDHAYPDGTVEQWQKAFFEIFETPLARFLLRPSPGNHDYYTSPPPYFDLLRVPEYYSFDVGNAHFISLDSIGPDRSRGGPMLQWLERDLRRTRADWIIAYFHHPPYTRGTHDSDSECRPCRDMRNNAVRVLEQYEVDLVLSGHSHGYERSFLIDGHYGTSSTFSALDHLVDGRDGDQDGPYDARGRGTVYVVAGSSSKTGLEVHGFNHPAMVPLAGGARGRAELGSFIVDIQGEALFGTFLNHRGQVKDRFSMVRGEVATDSRTFFSSGFEVAGFGDWSRRSCADCATTGNHLAATDRRVRRGQLALVLDYQAGSDQATYLIDRTPRVGGGAATYRASFFIQPEKLRRPLEGEYSLFELRQVRSERSLLELFLESKPGSRTKHYLSLRVVTDDGVKTTDHFVIRSGRWTRVTVEWKAASSSEAADGYARLFKNRMEVSGIRGLANSAHRVEEANLGCLTAGRGDTAAEIIVDTFESSWSRRSEVSDGEGASGLARSRRSPATRKGEGRRSRSRDQVISE